MEKLSSYRELIVWQKAMGLVIAVYKLTEAFPSSEIYGLTSQTRRAAVSIASNIAEGRSRGTKKEFRQFLITAFSSGSELETQVEISNRLSFGSTENRLAVSALLSEVMKMLNTMISKFQPTL